MGAWTSMRVCVCAHVSVSVKGALHQQEGGVNGGPLQ